MVRAAKPVGNPERRKKNMKGPESIEVGELWAVWFLGATIDTDD